MSGMRFFFVVGVLLLGFLWGVPWLDVVALLSLGSVALF